MQNREITQLINEAKAGNDRAFETLVKLHDRKVLSMALKFTGNEDDAMDIYQEVFIRVHRGLATFEFRSEFSTWLHRITMNVLINHKNRTRQELIPITEEVEDDEQPGVKNAKIISINETPESGFIATEKSMAIRIAIDSLPQQQKLAFTLKHLSGHKIKEIAEMMDCSEGTIKRYIFTASSKLREKLKYLL